MNIEIPADLRKLVSGWADLDRTKRRDLGVALRRLGLSYGEIQATIPIPKSTLNHWLRDVRLSRQQIDAIETRNGPRSRRGTPVNTQWRRGQEIQEIRSDASRRVGDYLTAPLFSTGVSLYWGEGSKTPNDLSMTNADPRVLSTFVRFVRAFLDADASFAMALNLHEGDDEDEAMHYWRSSLGLESTRFTKSFIKPAGTGHRLKKLPYGVCRLRVDRSSDHWHRVMQWIDDIAALLTA